MEGVARPQDNIAPILSTKGPSLVPVLFAGGNSGFRVEGSGFRV